MSNTPQGSTGDGAANANISPQQARLRAAAAAAAIYEKSFVYPSPSTLVWYFFPFCFLICVYDGSMFYLGLTRTRLLPIVYIRLKSNEWYSIYFHYDLC